MQLLLKYIEYLVDKINKCIIAVHGIHKFIVDIRTDVNNEFIVIIRDIT